MTLEEEASVGARARRCGMSVPRYLLAYWKGAVAWFFVVRLCPLRWVGRLPASVLASAGFYAYDPVHDRACRNLLSKGGEA